MTRKIILQLVLFVLLVYTGAAKNIPANLVGPDIVMEGATYKYVLEYRGTLPSGASLQWSSINGNITNSNADPSGGKIFADVQWDYHQTTGSVTISEVNTGYSLTINVQIIPIYQQVPHWSICDAISPVTQNVTYSLAPATLSIVNCVTLPSPAPYIFEYQWEYSNYDPQNPTSFSWISIWNGTGADYTPDPMIAFGTKLFRRKTAIWNTSHTVLHGTITSQIASVNLNTLDGGQIFSTTFPGAMVIVPLGTAIGSNRVSTTAASGGYCTSYTYTWEIAYEGLPFVFLGNGEQFPGASIIVNNIITLRRKAVCGTESAYSNYLVIDPDYNSPWSETLNYIRTNVILKGGVHGWFEADALTAGDKVQATTYFDGLGRPIQTVTKDGACENCETTSPSLLDVVHHTEYDAADRITKNFLPYPTTSNAGKFKANAATDQPQVILSFYNEASGAPTWSEIIYEQTPLSKVTTMKDAGTSWGGNPAYQGVSNSKGFNNAFEEIVKWNISYTSGSMPVPAGFYDEKKLIKTAVVNNEGKRVVEYTDFDGKVILRKVEFKEPGPDLEENGYKGWLCSYFIYDDFNRLRYELTPKAVEWLITRSTVDWTLQQDIVDELSFYYEYDERGRAVVKHTPGNGKIYLVYDKRDRLVFSQDEKQRQRTVKQWSYILYDELDRPVVTGLVDYNTDDRQSLQNSYVYTLGMGTISISVLAGNLGSENIKLHNPVVSSACGSCGTNIVNEITYYDNYNIPQKKTFNTAFSFPSNMPANVELTTAQSVTIRTGLLVTGKKVRVLNADYDDNNPSNDPFIIANNYYDEKARPIQSLSETYTGNGKMDQVVTTQFDFAGRALANCEKHGASGSVFSNFYIYTKYELDKLGRLKILYKKYSNGASSSLADANLKKIAMYAYDKMGRLKTRTLAPGFDNSPISNTYLESIDYEYNIHGWLTGINKGYTNNSNPWEHYFGMYIGYDDRSSLLSNGGLLNGKISGTIYKSYDGSLRKYEYSYDNVGRLKNAVYAERLNAQQVSWTNANADFSTVNIQYDENGNLKQMDQKSVLPGQTGWVYMDKLVYNYKNSEWSNQLAKVTDQGHGMGANNGKLGDFKDGTNSGDDYFYDKNGNLEKDFNKDIRSGSANGVTYNYLDKPQVVVVDNLKRIEFIYDATGNKLGKKVVDLSGGATPDKYTWYASQFVYEQVGSGAPELQYINHEEGRVRIITPHPYNPWQIPNLLQTGSFSISGTTKSGVYDYYIKDHLGSVRMVVTEEEHQEVHIATMETANSTQQQYEEDNFGTPGTANEVSGTRVSRASTPWPSSNNSTDYVSKLYNATGKTIGPNYLFKVMSGDMISAYANYYYEPVSNPGNGSIINDVVGSLVSALSTGGARAAGYNKGLQTQLQNNLLASGGALQYYLNNMPGSLPSDAPKAYLTVLFFDENFNLIPPDPNGNGSNSYPTNTPYGSALGVGSTVPTNGYAFIFVSNGSGSTHPIYFDDIVVTHSRRRVLEENHYYPFGLKNTALSARAFSKMDVKNGFQGEWSEEEDVTGWNEFGLRMYDPQIGRFISSDPYDQFASGYIGMGNDPINGVDPTGGEWGIISSAATVGMAMAAAGTIYALTSGQSENAKAYAFAGLIAGTALGLSSYELFQSFSALNIGSTMIAVKNTIELARAANLMATSGNNISGDPAPPEWIYVEVYDRGVLTNGPYKDEAFGVIQTSVKVINPGDNHKLGVKITRITYTGFASEDGHYFALYRQETQEFLPPHPGVSTPKLEWKPTKVVREVTALNVKIPWQRLPRQIIIGPPPPPQPIFIDIQFFGGTNAISNAPVATPSIAAIAARLIADPTLRVTLIGHGGDGPSNSSPSVIAPAATTPNSASLNGNTTSQSALFQARAEAVRQTLITQYGINPGRITALPGNYYNSISGRRVQANFGR